MDIVEMMKGGKTVRFSLQLVEEDTGNTVSVTVDVFSGGYDSIVRNLSNGVVQGLERMGITRETIDG